jgi:hypothetical protein
VTKQNSSSSTHITSACSGLAGEGPLFVTKYRVDVGTDIALIGAWDQSQNRNVLPALPFAQHRANLTSDAELGRVFLLQLGGDWGGPIDVFVDTEVPRSHRSKFKKLEGKFLVAVPTGRLVVGGAEDYRSEHAKITSEKSVISLPAGDYQLQCYCAKNEEEPAFVMLELRRLKEGQSLQGGILEFEEMRPGPGASTDA